jgi:ribosome-associated toxin RatA of RatAB toxin-antitoxin module
MLLVRCARIQVFDVVRGIEEYSEFIPWCRAAQILRRFPPPDQDVAVGQAEARAVRNCEAAAPGNSHGREGQVRGETLSAKLEVGFQGLSETYTSRVTLIRPSLILGICACVYIFIYI